MIDPEARIDPRAKIAAGVSIGPWTQIGADVEIGENTWIGSNVVINGPTKIGSDNKIYQFSSIGEDPQDKKYHGEKSSFLEIGDRNTIREFCTFNRGTESGGGVTKIGNDNWIMAYVHIAHDCQVGNQTIFANNASLAGHVEVDDYAILGGFTLVHQFSRIGQYSFCAFSSSVSKDIPPYVMVSENPAKARGLNREGLKRNGFSPEVLLDLKRAYRIMYRQNLIVSEAIERIEETETLSQEVRNFIEFIKKSERGIVR